MPLSRDKDGTWSIELDESDRPIVERSHHSYLEALPRYLTALDIVFERARNVSEFNFLWSIFAVRGMQDAGWDPYATTTSAINAIRSIHEQEIDNEASRHLGLWLYGHIMEASEPYEFLANLIEVAAGGRFRTQWFPPRANGSPLSPSTKIQQLQQYAMKIGVPEVVAPMMDSWDRDLRNAVFHADYSFHGSEVRTIRPPRIYSHEEIMTLINRAMACHEALSLLRTTSIQSYTEPKLIAGDPEFSRNPSEGAVVIVREGYGAVGIKDAWTQDDLAHGCIPYRVGRMTWAEMQLLDENPTLALLPKDI